VVIALSLVGLLRVGICSFESVGIAGASSNLGGGVRPFSPNERALLAREVKDGGCCRGCDRAGLDAEYMLRLLGNNSSSSGSRSGSSDEGKVEVELYRAELPEDS
jgi:hypothetical protein